MLLGLKTGEFAVLAADGEVVLVFGPGGLQIGLYARDGGVKVLLGEFAFPDGDDGSGEDVETLGAEQVSLYVPGHLSFPEIDIALRHNVFRASLVAVPETAVDEDDGPVFR